MDNYIIIKDYIIAIVISIGFFGISILAIYLYFKSKIFASIFKKFSFVFRWWLIGKTHCDTDDNVKTFYKVLHKIFWGFIVVSVVLTIGMFVEIVIYGG